MRASRQDDNHQEIAKALRRIGAGVVHTHQLKNAFDILVMFRGQIFMIEIKDGKKLPKKFWGFNESEKRAYLENLLTPGEKECRNLAEATRNNYHIVYDIDSAFEAIGANQPTSFKDPRKK